VNAAQLAKMCRCGHPRRKHNTGTIFVGYETKCHEFHLDWSDGPDCFYFEPAEGWEDAFAAELRKHGYIVQRVERGQHGRFVTPEVVA